MPSTYTLISSNVLASSAASVTFSAIPSTYTDLVLRMSTRFDGSAQTSNRFYLNASTTNGSQTILAGTGSSALTYNDTAIVYNYSYASVPGNTTTSNTFGSDEIYIPNYIGSAKKVASIFGTMENNATASYINASAALSGITAAVTSILLSPAAAGNFVAGSSFYLYGIKNS